MKDGPWGTQQEPVESLTVLDCCVTLMVRYPRTAENKNFRFIQSRLTSITDPVSRPYAESEQFSLPPGMKPLRKKQADGDPDRLSFWHHLRVLSYHHHKRRAGDWNVCCLPAAAAGSET